MAVCQNCQSQAKKPKQPKCSACQRSLTLCDGCYKQVNDDDTGLAAVKYHCSAFLTYLATGKACDAKVRMRWSLGEESEEAQKKRDEEQKKKLAALLEAIESRRDGTASASGAGAASVCLSTKERATIMLQIEHLAGWKKRACSCSDEHTVVLDRGRGKLLPIPEKIDLAKRKKLYAGLSNYAMRRMMQIHKICTPIESTKTAEAVRDAYLQATVCVTVLEKKGQIKLLLTENATQTSTWFLCVLRRDIEWVHEPDPIRYAVRGKPGKRHFYLHRMCETESLQSDTGQSAVDNSCTEKHASAEFPGPVHIRDKDHPDGYSLHHAELQAVHYAFRFGWNIVAMAPSHPCCAICSGTLAGLGLMSVVRHPHEWLRGADFQTLNGLSDAVYFEQSNALKNLIAAEFAKLRTNLKNRTVDTSILGKRKPDSAEDEDEEPEESVEMLVEGAGGEGEGAPVEPPLQKKTKLSMLSASELEECDTLMSSIPKLPDDQIDALQSDTPLSEMCVTLPETDWLSIFASFDDGVAALVPQAGHDPREVVGITNSGNSCYLNSVLQVLIRTVAQSGLAAAFAGHGDQPLSAILHLFHQTYTTQAAQGTYIQESGTCYYTTELVDDLRTLLYEARVIGGMFSQEDALLALGHILEQHDLRIEIAITKRYVLDPAKQGAAADSSAVDDNGDLVTVDRSGVLRLSLDGLGADVTLDAVLAANWTRDYGLAGTPTDTRVINHGITYHGVALRRETWAWNGAVPAQFFLGINRFFFRDGAPGKNAANVDAPLQLARWGLNYALWGFFVHEGTTVHGGHYVSYIRSTANPNNWYRISDRDVTVLAHNAPALDTARRAGYGYFYGP